MAFNIRSIKTLEKFDLQIKDTDGNPTGVTFTLAGPTHPIRKAQEQAVARKLINEANKTGKVKLPDPAEAEEKRPADLAALTLNWSGYADENGPVNFTPEEARKLYADPELKWLADQVEEALNNKQLFTKAVSGS